MKLDKKSEIFMNLHGALGKLLYQLPLILTAMLHVDLINVAYLTACVMMTLHFLNGIVIDVESTRKSIITSYSLA